MLVGHLGPGDSFGESGSAYAAFEALRAEQSGTSETTMSAGEGEPMNCSIITETPVLLAALNAERIRGAISLSLSLSHTLYLSLTFSLSQSCFTCTRCPIGIGTRSLVVEYNY